MESIKQLSTAAETAHMQAFRALRHDGVPAWRHRSHDQLMRRQAPYIRQRASIHGL